MLMASAEEDAVEAMIVIATCSLISVCSISTHVGAEIPHTRPLTKRARIHESVKVFDLNAVVSCERFALTSRRRCLVSAILPSQRLVRVLPLP